MSWAKLLAVGCRTWRSAIKQSLHFHFQNYLQVPTERSFDWLRPKRPLKIWKKVLFHYATWKKNCCSYFRIDVSCVNYYTNQYRDAYRYAQRQNHDTQVVNSLWFCCCYTSLQSPSCINTLTAQRRYQQATKFSVIFIGSEHMVYRRPKVGIIAWFVYYVTCFCQTVWQKDSDVLLLVRFAKTYPQNLTCQWYILIQFCPRASFPEGLSWLK